MARQSTLAGALALALAAMVWPSAQASWSLGRTVLQIAGPDAERLSSGLVFPGLPETVQFLASQPQRRVASYFAHAEDALSSFDPTLAAGPLLQEGLYPRRVLDVRLDALAAGDLLAMPLGKEPPLACRELFVAGSFRVLEALP